MKVGDLIVVEGRKRQIVKVFDAVRGIYKTQGADGTRDYAILVGVK